MHCFSCSCCLRAQCRPVDIIGRTVVEPLVPPPAIVEVEVGGELAARLGEVLVGVQVHLLVLDASPESLDEDVVEPATAAVYADGAMPWPASTLVKPSQVNCEP